ncbi:MAG: hypothetical protein VX278_23135 [Myxococcota bacterium]|nr:hypothetical protein [Myxococcota bacterium]
MRIPLTLRALLFSFALSCLVLLPSWKSANHIIGHPNLDMWSHAWGMDWFGHTMLSFQFPWWVEGVAWPSHRVLWYIDPIGAIVTLPLQLFLNPIWTYNLLFIIQLTVLGYSAWLFARTIGGKGWLAATVLCTAPYLQGEIWNGVTEACWLAVIPLCGYLAQKRTWWCGITLGFSIMATPYHGIGAALLVTTVALTHPEESWKKNALWLSKTAGLSLLFALPHILLLAYSIQSPDSFVSRSFFGGFNPAVLLSNAVDPLALVHPGDYWSQTNNDNRFSVPWRKTPYLGLCALSLSLLLVFRHRGTLKFFVPASIGVVACLGIYLWHDGQWVQSSNGSYYKLPLAYLVENSPLSLDHPLRFVGVSLCCLAIMADRFVGKWGIFLCGFVAYEHLVLAPNSWPLPSTDAQLPAVYDQIPDDGRAILDLPADAGVGNSTNRYLLWQRLHGHPVPWSNKVSAMGVPSQNPAVIKWGALTKESGGYIEGLDKNQRISASTLTKERYGYIILHTEFLKNSNEEQKFAEITQLFGPPKKVGSARLWVVPE